MKYCWLLLWMFVCSMANAQQADSVVYAKLSLEDAMQTNFLETGRGSNGREAFNYNPTDSIVVYTDRNVELCKAAKSDARAYHRKNGANFALGYLFGAFGVIGTLAGNPKPERGRKTFMESPNTHMMKDPVYRKCYKQEAKTLAVEHSLYGWVLSMFMFVFYISQ